jgi:Tol biopolymer transport system component
MSLDGSNQVQLTTGGGKASPAISPDSQSVLYNTTDDWNLWKVAIDGGNPVRLTDYFSSRPAISPDGKMIAYVTGTESKRQISVMSFPGGQPLRVFDFDGWSSRLQWAPDGKALIYAVRRNRVTSLLKQPVTNGPLEEIVSFGTDELFDFSYSFNGRFLTAMRGGWHHDVVLIKDLMLSLPSR